VGCNLSARKETRETVWVRGVSQLPAAAMFRKTQQAGPNPNYSAPKPQRLARSTVQEDWEQREFTASIQLGVTQLTAFLNEFEGATRGRLALLNGKLAQIERRMTLVEATLQSVDQETN